VRTRAAAALAAVAALAGCGGSAPRVHVVRPAKPVWCPQHLGSAPAGGFDARQVLGRSLADAQRLGAAHDCRVRPTTIDGRSLALTLDFETNRADVIVEHGTVTRFDLRNGPIG
jgi:hypothetical protein